MEEKRFFYVAVSRQFGSGGAETASKLATKLGVNCYDKSIAEMTSVLTGIDKDLIHSSEDKTSNNFWYSGFLGGDSLSTYDKVFMGQSRVIKNLAKKGSCVFVGRCATKVLENKENVVRVFISAPLSQRISRISNLYKISPIEAEKMIKKNDKARAQYNKKYGEIKWGACENYDLCLSTSIGTNKTAEIIVEYMKKRGLVK